MTLEELAATISQALVGKGIIATLSGGAAVQIYTDNEYLSKDLDFVTSSAHRELSRVLEPLGFKRIANSRLYEHPASEWLLEFPSGPLSFGDQIVDQETIDAFESEYGPLRIIPPTLSLLDRLAAYSYHNDPQCFDQAKSLAKLKSIDWTQVEQWLISERLPMALLDELRQE